MNYQDSLLGASSELSEEERKQLCSFALGALSLPARAENALRRAGVENALSAIVSVLSEDFAAVRGIGRKTAIESEQAIRRFLLKYRGDNGQKRWLHDGPPCASKARDVPLEAVGLSNRAHNALRRAGAQNLLDAFELQRSGRLAGLPGVGAKTILQAQRAIESTLEKLQGADPIELEELIAARKIVAVDKSSLSAMVEHILELATKKTPRKLRERNRTVINKRFGIDGSQACTLQDLATYYDLTRERVRQIQNKILLTMRRIMRRENSSAGWSVDNESGTFFGTLSSLLEETPCFLSNSELETVLPFPVDTSRETGHLRLLMAVFDFEPLSSTAQAARCRPIGWYASTRRSAENVEELFRSFDAALELTGTEKTFDLIVRIKRQHGLPFGSPQECVAEKIVHPSLGVEI